MIIEQSFIEVIRMDEDRLQGLDLLQHTSIASAGRAVSNSASRLALIDEAKQ
jgi:hypothetical protein